MPPTRITDAELLGYLDEALSVEQMTRIEQELRNSPELLQRAAGLLRSRDAGGVTVGEVWRRMRLSCPSRVQLGSYLLDACSRPLAEYIRFHLETIGCRVCLANVEDLKRHQPDSAESQRRRDRFFKSSAGVMRSRNADE
jgi:hypothetical protein